LPERPCLHSWDLRSFTVLPEATYLGSPQNPGVNLLKLHGSVHWTYSGADQFFGESLRDGTLRRWSAALNDYTPFALEEGRVPLLVPPTLNKNRYFDNEKVRHMWRRAWFALANARRVFCIGYGMPAGDLLMQSLLHDSARVRRSEVAFYVINRSSTAPEHYRQALPARFLVDGKYSRVAPDVTEEFVCALLAGELDAQDKPHIAAIASLLRERIGERCPTGSIERNDVKGTTFAVGKMDEYGIVLPDPERSGKRYVVWEVWIDLLRRVRVGEFNKYLMPDDGHPTLVPFAGDPIVFSLLRRIAAITESISDNRIQFSVDAELASQLPSS
jgi:hypothetical protein